MKTLFLLLLTVSFIPNSFSQIINIPDANFKAKLLASQPGVGIAYGCNGVSFKIDANNNGEIEVSEALEVCKLHVDNSGISDMTGIEYFTNLTLLDCVGNSITTLDASPFTDLWGLHFSNNLLSSLNVVGLANLNNMSISNNQLTTLDMTGLSSLRIMSFNNNPLSTLDLSVVPELAVLRCKSSMLTTLDASAQSGLINLDVSNNNNLVSLYIKNGASEYQLLDFSQNPSLQYVCADATQLNEVEAKIVQYGYTNCFTNSICTFIPGDDFYTVIGNAKYDEDQNGCNALDNNYPNLNLIFSDGTNSGNVIADSFGDYHYSVQAGTFSITPQLENPTYFSVFPTTTSVTFPAQPSPFVQDFCIESNGQHPDLKITVPFEAGYIYPGEETSYIIAFSNQGTMTQSGSVHFTYNDAVTNYISSTPPITSTDVNMLIWDFNDLLPFETREIVITLYIHSQTDDPPLVDGDVLSFSVSVISSEIDETPADNTVDFNQIISTVVLDTKEFEFSDYFTLFPNPTDATLYLKTERDINVQSLTIYDLSGQLIKIVPIEKDTTKIDVSELQTGIYFIAIQSNKGNYYTRFIKE